MSTKPPRKQLRPAAAAPAAPPPDTAEAQVANAWRAVELAAAKEAMRLIRTGTPAQRDKMIVLIAGRSMARLDKQEGPDPLAEMRDKMAQLEARLVAPRPPQPPQE